MFVSIFYKCFTLVVLFGLTDLGACLTAEHEHLIPTATKTAIRRELGRQYQPEGGQDVHVRDASDDLLGVAKREAPPPQSQDLAAIRRRFSLGEDLQSIAQENFQRELARDGPADNEAENDNEMASIGMAEEDSASLLDDESELAKVSPTSAEKSENALEDDEPVAPVKKSANLFDEVEQARPSGAETKGANLFDDDELARPSAAEKKGVNLLADERPARVRPTAASKKIAVEALDDEVPHLNYYYPSIGNKIGPMAAPFHRQRRHDRADRGVKKREALLEDDSDAEKDEPAFPVKHVIQKPIAIDADSLLIDEPASMEWNDELEGRGNAFSRRRRRTQKIGRDERNVDSDEEGAANFIHYQIENLKAKVKREFEQSPKLTKRSKVEENYGRGSGNEKRDTKGTRAKSSEVKREFVPSASPSKGTKRRRQAVVMDLEQFEELDRNDALRSNVLKELENVKKFNLARAKKQAPHGKSLSRVTRDASRFRAEKAENDAFSHSNEGLKNEREKRKLTSFGQDEWKMLENVPSSTVDKVKRKRNVESLAIDRRVFENDEFAPAAFFNSENTMKRRRRREVGEYLAGNSLKEKNPLTQPSKSFLTKREYSNSKTDDFSKDIIQKNEADIEKMKQDLDNLFKTINLSKSKNIIPSSSSQNVWKKFPKNKMAEENGQENASDNYMEINENSPEYGLENNAEKAQATHHALESLDDSSEHADVDALKESRISSKGSLSASKSKCQSSIDDSAEEEEVDDLERQAEDIVNRRQMGSRSSDHRVRNSMFSPNVRSPRRRLLSLSETSVAEDDHDNSLAEHKQTSATGFDGEMMSNGQDELQEDKVLPGGDKTIQNSQTIKESDVSQKDVDSKSEVERGDMSFGQTEDSASGNEEELLEKQNGHDISYGSENVNDSPSIKDKRQVSTQENKKPVVESSKTAVQDTEDSDSEEKLTAAQAADRFKEVDRELREHNQRAIEFRDMDVKVGPQVADVARLIAESRQKESNRERNQLSCENTVVSLTRTDNDHTVRKKSELDATSPTLNEERSKRSPRHHNSNYTALNEKADKLPVDNYPQLTGDLDIDLNRYFYGDDKDLHRSAFHDKSKANYKPVVDWQVGDRERFAQLQAHRKLNGGGYDDSQIIPTLTNSDISNEIRLQEFNNQKFNEGRTKLGEYRDLRSNAESLDPLSKIIRPEKPQVFTFKTPRNNLSQRRKLFELLKLSKSKLNSESARHEVEATAGAGGSWLELFFKNQGAAAEDKRMANAMESDGDVMGADRNVHLEVNPDETQYLLKKSVSPDRHPQSRRPDGYGVLRPLRDDYVIKKRDLTSGGGDDRPIGLVYTGRQFRDNNFHRRRVPPYGLPSADLFNKWDLLGDVHGFSKSLFNNLQSNPDEDIVAGFDNEGKYISPIALDRVKRMRHRRRRRRRRGVPEERRRRRRGRRRTYLFPAADPVEEFFGSRPARAVEGEDEEEEGEASPRAVRLRERRALARRDEKGWPVTRSGGCGPVQHLSAVALVALQLGHYAS